MVVAMCAYLLLWRGTYRVRFILPILWYYAMREMDKHTLFNSFMFSSEECRCPSYELRALLSMCADYWHYNHKSEKSG